MEHSWGLPVALDLFFAGVGAGAFVLAVVAQLVDDRRYRAVSLTGALIAPWPVILGVLLLLADLGKPMRFWELLFRSGPGFLMFNITSTMSIGTWLLTLFVLVSLGYMLVYVVSIPFRWGKIARAVCGLAGLPFALLVAIYTGVLISATNNPLWSTPLLPMVFVSSALATGTACVVFWLALFQVFKPKLDTASAVPRLERLTAVIIVVQLIVLAVMMATLVKVDAMKAIMGPMFGLLWWIGVVGLGLVVPLLLGLKGGSKRPQTALVVATLVLLGGFFMRYVILMAGQVV